MDRTTKGCFKAAVWLLTVMCLGSIFVLYLFSYTHTGPEEPAEESIFTSSQFEVSRVSSNNTGTSIVLERHASGSENELTILQRAAENFSSEKVWENGLILPDQTEKIFLEFSLQEGSYPKLPVSGQGTRLDIRANYCSLITYSDTELEEQEVRSYTVCSSKCNCEEPVTVVEREGGAETAENIVYRFLVGIFDN